MAASKSSFSTRAIVRIFIVIFCTPRVTDAGGKDFLEQDHKDHLLTTMSCFCGIVALPFLLVTVIVYSVIPKFGNIHGTTLRCYLCCLIGGHVGSLVQGMTTSHNSSSTLCLCLGFAIYFSYIASFMWLNVICIDMWWKFGNFGSLRTSGTQNDHKKFIYYSMYAWGIAFLLTAIFIGMELIPGIPDSLVRPGLGKTLLDGSGVCWINSKMGLIVYMIIPIGVTVLCNICLFIYILIKLVMYNKDAKRYLNSTDNRQHQNRKWFTLYLKLFIVMGISWSAVLIPIFWWVSKPAWSFVAMITCALPGILTSVILVCKKDIWESVKERCCNKEDPLVSIPRNSVALIVRV